MRALYDFESDCLVFMEFCSFKRIKRHILPSSHLFLWRLRNRGGAATSVFGAAEGREGEGWDKALCKRKISPKSQFSSLTTVPHLNQNLVIERKQEKLLKWERDRERRRQQEWTHKENKEGGFLCWECRNGSVSHLSHFLGNPPMLRILLCGLSN